MAIRDIITGKEVEVPQEIKKILNPGEEVIHSFEQASITGKVGGAHSIYVTNERVFKLVPRTLGLRRNLEDFRYEDMANVSMKRGITRSDIHINMRFLSDDVMIRKIPKDGANNILKTLQDGIAGRLKKQESPSTITDSSQSDIPDQIKKLAELKNDGILSEEEFEEKKKKLLEKI